MANGNIQPVEIGLISNAQIKLYYKENPYTLQSIDEVLPLKKTTSDVWRTKQNKTNAYNVEADLINSDSPIPTKGRDGFISRQGDFLEIGVGKKMNSEEIQKYVDMQADFLASDGNLEAANALIAYFGDDLEFVRTGITVKRIGLAWSLISNACNLTLPKANNPYLHTVAALDYGVKTWQKTKTGTTWSNAAALILDDIQNQIDLGVDHGKEYHYMFVNKKTWADIRNNTQVQSYTNSLFANQYSVKSAPSVEEINATFTKHFDTDFEIFVVDTKNTREINGVYTTYNPFADGVAVFSESLQLGRTEWKALAIIDSTKETANEFYTVGNKLNTDPNYSKTYSKAKLFPVIDTAFDNVYCNIDTTSW